MVQKRNVAQHSTAQARQLGKQSQNGGKSPLVETVSLLLEKQYMFFEIARGIQGGIFVEYGRQRVYVYGRHMLCTYWEASGAVSPFSLVLLSLIPPPPCPPYPQHLPQPGGIPRAKPL